MVVMEMVTRPGDRAGDTIGPRSAPNADVRPAGPPTVRPRALFDPARRPDSREFSTESSSPSVVQLARRAAIIGDLPRQPTSHPPRQPDEQPRDSTRLPGRLRRPGRRPGAGPLGGRGRPPTPAGPIKVVVWDERQPAQKQAYDNFLGNRIADHLRSEPGLAVESVGLDDPGRGLSPDVLDDARVLVWWGHVRNKEIEPEVGRAIVERIKAGTLGLIALHSAHWSTPLRRGHERAGPDRRPSEVGGRRRQGRDPRDPPAPALHHAQGRRPADPVLDRPEAPRRRHPGRPPPADLLLPGLRARRQAELQPGRSGPTTRSPRASPASSSCPRPRCTTRRSTSPSPTR